MTTVWLVRHGRTDANHRGVLLGRADPSLDETGRAQAAAAGELLRNETGHIGERAEPHLRIVSSPLQRCVETAEIIGSGFGVEPTRDDRLVELDYGEWDLRAPGDIPAETWAEWRSDPDFAPPRGESLARLGARVHEFLDELRSDGEAGQIVLVTHVSPIKAAIAWALGVDTSISWRCHVAQASIHRLVIGRNGPSLHSFNRTDHLD